jgi:hypothetical protein
MSPPTGPNYGYGRGFPSPTLGRVPFGHAGTPAMPGMPQGRPSPNLHVAFPEFPIPQWGSSSSAAASAGQHQPQRWAFLRLPENSHLAGQAELCGKKIFQDL